MGCCLRFPFPYLEQACGLKAMRVQQCAKRIYWTLKKEKWEDHFFLPYTNPLYIVNPEPQRFYYGRIATNCFLLLVVIMRILTDVVYKLTIYKPNYLFWGGIHVQRQMFLIDFSLMNRYFHHNPMI